MAFFELSSKQWKLFVAPVLLAARVQRAFMTIGLLAMDIPETDR